MTPLFRLILTSCAADCFQNLEFEETYFLPAYYVSCRVRGDSDYPWRTFWETLLGIVRYHDWGISVVTVDQHGEGGDSCQCDASCVSSWTKQEEVSELYLPGSFVECLCGECIDCVLFILACITIVITIVICSGKTKARKHVLKHDAKHGIDKHLFPPLDVAVGTTPWAYFSYSCCVCVKQHANHGNV